MPVRKPFAVRRHVVYPARVAIITRPALAANGGALIAVSAEGAPERDVSCHRVATSHDRSRCGDVELRFTALRRYRSRTTASESHLPHLSGRCRVGTTSRPIAVAWRERIPNPPSLTPPRQVGQYAEHGMAAHSPPDDAVTDRDIAGGLDGPMHAESLVAANGHLRTERSLRRSVCVVPYHVRACHLYSG
jgi:hypothetical protein